MTTDPSPAEADATRRGMVNTWILMAAQALNGSAAVVSISLSGLAGAYLLGADKSLATLPAAAFAVGLALGALPAALIMQRFGRRTGLLWGCVAGICGLLLAAGAISLASFWLFALGLLFVGVSGSFVQQYRFAAAQAVPDALRGLAISRVMIGGILTAIAAPQLILLTRDLLDPLPFAGAFLAVAAVLVVGLAVLTRLRIAGPRASSPARSTGGEGARPLGEIIRQPRFLASLLCAASSFALMSFVMTAAPLAMVGHQHSEADALLGIQWHVIAMFAPSLVTGRLIARFGKEAIATVGLVLLVLSALVALAGVQLLHFWWMLVLLGVGWNFSFIGATAILTDTYRPAERGRVEGFNDLVVFGTVAVASYFSGRLLTTAGWEGINLIVLPITAGVLLTLFLLAFQSRRRPA